MGRKPKGERAMTAKERMQKHRKATALEEQKDKREKDKLRKTSKRQLYKREKEHNDKYKHLLKLEQNLRDKQKNAKNVEPNYNSDQNNSSSFKHRNIKSRSLQKVKKNITKGQKTKDRNSF